MNDRILPTTTNLLGAMEAHVATIAPDTSGALEKATVLHDLAATETDALSSAFTQAFADWKDDLLSDAALSSMFGKTQDAVRAVSARVDTAAAELATAERALTEAQNDRSSVADQLTKDQVAFDAAKQAFANRQAALTALQTNLASAEASLRTMLEQQSEAPRLLKLSDLFVPKTGSTTIPTGSSVVLPGGSGTTVTVRELNTELISLADGYFGAGSASQKWPEVYVDLSKPAYVESFDLRRVSGGRPAEIRITNLDGSVEKISTNGGITMIGRVVKAVSWDRMASENIFHINVTFKVTAPVATAPDATTVAEQRLAVTSLQQQITSMQILIGTDTSVPAAQSALAATQQKLAQADLLVAQRSEAVASARQTYAGVQSDRGTLEREYSLLSAKVAAIPSTGVRLEREVQEGLLSVGREWNFTVEKPAVENLQSLFRDLAAEQLWAAEHERLQEERVFTLSSLFTPKAGSTTIPTGSSAVLPGGSGTVVTVRELNTELISLADGYLGAGGSTKWPEVYVDFSQPAYVESFDLLRVAGSRPAEIRITNLDGSIERISSNGGSTIIEKVVQAVSWDRMVSENVFHVNVTFKTSPEIEEANRLMTLKSALEAQDAEIAEQLRILQLRDALSVSDRREAAFALDVFPKDSPQWKAAAAALDHSRPETMQNSPEMHVVGVEGNRIVFEVFGSPGETYAVEQRYQGSGGTWVTGESKNVAMPSGQSSSLVSFYVTSAVQATSLSFCLSNAKTGIVPGSTATFGWNAVSRQLSITQESFPSLALRAGESAGSINDIQVDLLKACTKELLQQEAPAYSPIVFNYGTNIQASKDIIFNGQGISCDVNQIALWQLQQGNPDKWGTVGTDWIQAARAYCARNHTNEGDEIRGMQYDLSWQANKVMKDYNLLVQCVTDYFYSLLEGKLGNGVTAYDTRALNIGGQFFPGTQAIVAAMETNFRSIYGKLKAFEGEEVMELAARDRASEAAGTAQRIEENARHALDLAVQYMQSNPDSLGTPLSTRISTLTGNLDPAIMQKVTDEMKAGTYVGGLTPAQQQMVVQGFVAFYGGSTPSGNVAATPLDTRVIAHGELNDRFLATIMTKEITSATEFDGGLQVHAGLSSVTLYLNDDGSYRFVISRLIASSNLPVGPSQSWNLTSADFTALQNDKLSVKSKMSGLSFLEEKSVLQAAKSATVFGMAGSILSSMGSNAIQNTINQSQAQILADKIASKDANILKKGVLWIDRFGNAAVIVSLQGSVHYQAVLNESIEQSIAQMGKDRVILEDPTSNGFSKLFASLDYLGSASLIGTAKLLQTFTPDSPIKLGIGLIALPNGNTIKIDYDSLTPTAKVASQVLERPYNTSISTIKHIVESSPAVADEIVKGAYKWVVPGTYNGSVGIFELVIDPTNNKIMHFLFTTKI